MNILLKIIFFFVFILSLPSCAAENTFEVKHADSLEVINDLILVKGNIVIHYRDAIIEAPEGNIETIMGGDPQKATFTGRVKITLEDRKIEADKITFQVADKTTIAEGNTIAELKDKEGTPLTIFADYQELNNNSKNAQAKGNIKTLYKETIVRSDEVLVVYKNGNPSQAIYYGINRLAELEQPTIFTKSKSITFDINTHEVHASGQVNSTIWPDEKIAKDKQDPVHVAADDVFIEEENQVTATGSNNLVKVVYQDTTGESLKALLLKNKDTGKPEKIIFTGNAEVSQTDKKLISEEVLFNFNDKTLVSNTKINIRPKTIIFKMDSMG